MYIFIIEYFIFSKINVYVTCLINAYLVHVRIFLRISEHVERGVQLIKHVDDFHRTAGVRVSGAVGPEAHDSREQQGHAVVLLRRNWPRVPELVRHGNG